MSLETSERAVNAGQTTTSTSFTAANSRIRSVTKATASELVLLLFQLPATINLRSLSMRSRSGTLATAPLA